MFELDQTQIRILNFNPRVEKHGEENVPAGDLKIEVTVHNGVLDAFDKSLRSMLYRKPTKGEQTDLEFPGSDGMTQLRLPHLAPQKWDEDFPGYTIKIIEGMGLSDPITLTGCELSHFTFEAKEGGSVQITFRASFQHDRGQAGALCELIQETVEASVIPPSGNPKQQAKNDPQADLDRDAA